MNGPCGGLLAVLRVLRAQELERALVVVDHAPASPEPHPPQLRPVVVVVVDDDLDARVALDVGEASELPRPLRLLVDGRIERVAVEREADRNDAR